MSPSRFTRSSARKSKAAETITLSSDEEDSGDDESVFSSPLDSNQHLIEDTVLRIRSMHNKHFVDCTKIAIGNQVHRKPSVFYSPSRSNGTKLEISFLAGRKIDIDLKEITELYFSQSAPEHPSSYWGYLIFCANPSRQSPIEIGFESKNQKNFEKLISLLRNHNELYGFFNSHNWLSSEDLQEKLIHLNLQGLCDKFVFPNSHLYMEVESIASKLIEANGKLRRQSDESMFSNLTNKRKRASRKQDSQSITIRGEDYDRLAPGEFLNDTLIDFWMNWLIYRMGDVSNQVHVCNTQFYTKLEAEGVASVLSWTTKQNIDIFEKKYVFVPVNKHLHWSLLVIVNPGNVISDDDEQACNQNLEHPYILFMDSHRAHKKTELQKTIYKWLNAEAARL